MISLRRPLRCKECLRSSSHRRACHKFSDWPQGNSNHWPQAAGILSSEHLSQDGGSHVTPCVFHQVMNPSRAEWPGWVRPPTPPPAPQPCNALIGCSANLTNTSQQTSGCSELWSNSNRRRGWTRSSLSTDEIGNGGWLKFDVQAVRWEATYSERDGGFEHQFLS